MAGEGLANVYTEVTRLLGGVAPPRTPGAWAGDTQITGRWRNPPFEGHVPALSQHAIVHHVGGHSDAWAKVGGTTVRAPLVPGTISLVPRGQDCWRASADVIEVNNVFLGDERLQSCADQFCGGQRPELLDRLGHSDPKLVTIMSLLGDESPSADGLARLFTEQVIDLLCLHLLRAHSAYGPPIAPVRAQGLAPWQLKRVTAYMHDSLDREIGLDELANLVGVSRFHFCRAFRLATGNTPYQWLTHLRMSRARSLLSTSDLPIIQIALACGYQTPSAFSATFRRFIGVTPSLYRARR